MFTRRLMLTVFWFCWPFAVYAGNLTIDREPAVLFGVHELQFRTSQSASNPFDQVVQVAFTNPTGRVYRVEAFYDGDQSWRARVYIDSVGQWSWSTSCATDTHLHQLSGSFLAAHSQLPGRLIVHASNPRQWMTENGKWFLNLSDTAYFLLCQRDGNGDEVSDQAARQYVQDDVNQGITSVRCFLASRPNGFSEDQDQWQAWFFEDDTHDLLRLENFRQADRRLRMLLDEYPSVVVQLILTPLEGYAKDGQFWARLSTVQRQRLLRYLVARYAAYPQIQWLITNDAHYGTAYPRNNAMAREFGQYLQENDRWQHPRSTGHARRLPFVFGDEPWCSYVHIEHAHDLSASQYSRYATHAKPVFLGEDRYEQDHGPSQDPQHMRSWQRRLFWSWLLSGASANYGGRWWTLQPYRQTGRLPATYHKRPNVTFSTALVGLDSVPAIKGYFDQYQIDLGKFQPNHELAHDVHSDDPLRQPKVMRRDWSELIVYHPHAAADGQSAQVNASTSAQLTVDLRQMEGPLAVQWYRAEDGVSHSAPDVSGGQLLQLTAPWPSADVVLRLFKR